MSIQKLLSKARKAIQDFDNLVGGRAGVTRF